MAKHRRPGGQTREAWRMGRLFEQLIAKLNENQSTIARKLDIHPSYVNKLISGEREGVGAEVVSAVHRAFGVDPKYFTEDYEGERSHELYLMSHERNTDRIRKLETRVAELEEEYGKPASNRR